MIFFKRKNENRGVVVPSVVDAEMCEYFGVEADKKAWYNDWYNRFLVDFNLAYNPYCAYNEMWSCPITPFENRIKVPIRAGEKIFHSDH